MAPSGQVQRKCSGYFTQVMYADRTEAPERGSYETGLLVPLLPTPFFLSYSLLVSLREWGACHWLFLVPDVLCSLGSDHIWHSRDVYASGGDNNQNTLNISF